jgi:hypothetical protein
MPHAIPTYLVALAAGDIAFPRGRARAPACSRSTALVERRARSSRAGDHAAVAAGDRGPYRWGRADCSCSAGVPVRRDGEPAPHLRLPTLLAGDRSLTTIVVHELAHAWSGNLVTPATWNDFWLNEGLTVYLELRVNEALYGPERAAMLEAHGMRELDARGGAGRRHVPRHAPAPRPRGARPAVATTAVPYVKGAASCASSSRSGATGSTRSSARGSTAARSRPSPRTTSCATCASACSATVLPPARR